MIVPSEIEVANWVRWAFGDDIQNNVWERINRVMEEAIELAQAENMSKEDLYRLIDFVYAKPVGEPSQEVSGIYITLAAYCANKDISIEEVTWKEWSRINQPEMLEKMRAKHNLKKQAGVGLQVTATNER